jgi:hypothetical protein
MPQLSNVESYSGPGLAARELEPKPGPKTSEFWITAFTSIISLVVAIAALFGYETDPSVIQALVPALAVIAAAISTAVYSRSRSLLKVAASRASAEVLTAGISASGGESSQQRRSA